MRLVSLFAIIGTLFAIATSTSVPAAGSYYFGAIYTANASLSSPGGLRKA